MKLLISTLKIRGLKIAIATYTLCEKKEFTIIVSRAKFELQQQHEWMREIAEILRFSKFLRIINGFNGNVFNSAVLHFAHCSIPALCLVALLQCSSSSFSLCLSAHFLPQAFRIFNHIYSYKTRTNSRITLGSPLFHSAFVPELSNLLSIPVISN